MQKKHQKTHSHFNEIQYADSSSITYFKMSNYLDVPSLGNDRSSLHFIPDIKDKLDLLSPGATFAKIQDCFPCMEMRSVSLSLPARLGQTDSALWEKPFWIVQLMMAMSKSYKASDETDTLNNQILTEKNQTLTPVEVNSALYLHLIWLCLQVLRAL